MHHSSFTRTMLSIAVPVTLQNLLFSSFTLIDTLMIGALGDTPLAAVGMAGKWTWFFTIVLFGFGSGASVFIAQYFGADDTRGIHRTYGLLAGGSLFVSAVFMAASLLMPERFLQPEPLAAMIASEKPTLAAAVPTIWQAVDAYSVDHPIDMSSFRSVVVGGSSCPPGQDSHRNCAGAVRAL